MAVGARLTSFGIVIAVACGCGEDHSEPRPTVLEATIATQLGLRAGTPIAVHCTMAPPGCVATARGGITLPITLGVERGEWTWRVDGLFVRADEVEALVKGALDEVGVARTIDCGPRVRALAPDGRVECVLGDRGRAFVVVHADGSTELELVLDPAAAAARSAPSTPADEQALEASSHALEAADEADAEEQ